MAHYSLTRESDGAGDSGPMSEALDAKSFKVMGNRPIIGCCMRVGSHYARTMDHQDWWLTTAVVEILEENENFVRFKTKNSIYAWTSD